MKNFTKLVVLTFTALLAIPLLITGVDANTVDVNRARNLEQVEVSPFGPRYSYETLKITFDKNSSTLDSSAQRTLRDKLLDLSFSRELDQVTIAGYSDESYPPTMSKKLSAADSKLAKDRIRSIESEISDLEGVNVDVESFNLAQEPNTLERWFNTQNYRLKSAIKNNLTSTVNSPRSLRIIKDQGEQESALVIFRKRMRSSAASNPDTVSPSDIENYNEQQKRKRTELYSE